MSRGRLLPYLAFVGLSLVWGGSFLAIKLTVQDMSPTALLLFRSAAGFLALALIVLALRKPMFGAGWRGRLWGFAIMAVTNAVIPWVAIGWGEERISSGLASILNSTTTLWTAVLIYWVMPSERPSLVNYVGVLYRGGKVFDASWKRGEPTTFALEQGKLIAGWTQGIPGMKVGGRRELIIPAALAYGAKGSPPSIPPSAPLVFVIDLLGA